jgi:RND family efflux transporter MFP subunit
MLKLVVPILVIVGAIIGSQGLAALYQPPAHKDLEERALKVEVQEVTPEDVPVMITGYGTVESLDVVRVAPEVSGNIVEVHPQLEVGEVIPEGELLFKIDQRNYRANLAQARAQVAQAENTVARLKQQQQIDRERLTNLRRSAEIAETEYKRVQTLFKENDVGTQSGVDQAEIGLNNARDARDRLQQAVAIYPISIEEAEAGLEAAGAAVDLAEANLDRTEVRAPFDARIRMVQLEVGQFVSPGNAVMTLANDTMLELSVPLDSRDVRQWMQFADTDAQAGTAWFGQVKPVDCKVTWTESGDTQHWVGQLHRIEAFDPMTRTVTVAVRVSSEDARAGEGRLPMVDGMFCSVQIPGRELENVYKLSRWSVDFEGYVYIADADNRLQRLEVEVARNQGESAYISEGLSPGDRVVVTRLVNPLPNTRLEIVESVDAPAPPDEQEAVL